MDIHFGGTANGEACCNGYNREVPQSEPTTSDRTRVTCDDCMELIECDMVCFNCDTTFDPDQSDAKRCLRYCCEQCEHEHTMCCECARSFGPNYRGKCEHE